MADNVATAGASILVVDDEEIVLHLVEDTLSDEGYQVTTTPSARQAIQLAAQANFDFILTDIRMPEMNGIELVREIHQINPNIGVIFMTGYANLDTAKQAIKEGAFDYIMKPFELTEIRQAMTRAVQQKKSAAEAALSSELDKIAGLSNMIYTSGDLASLLRLSLSFAILQNSAEAGAAVYFDRRQETLSVMRVGKQSDAIKEDTKLPMAAAQWDSLPVPKTPYQRKQESDCPLFHSSLYAEVTNLLLPDSSHSRSGVVIVPLTRAEKMLGYLSLFQNKPGYELKGSDIQHLDFIANQLAISLENLQLLEDSREAYRRLEYLQDQTIQMEKMATRGQMSAEIGHELNNYLGVVIANFQLMNLRIQKGVTEGLERFTESIEAHLDKISRFTKGLMDYSSLQKTNFQKIDVNQMLQQIIDFLKPQKRFRNFTMEFISQTETLEAEIDQGTIEQVLYNFLNNAADASIDSPVKKIIIRTEALPGEMIRLSIKDHGAGISAENLNRLFKEKFTTKDTGHGIGLVVCKNIIDRHQGRFTVESTPGQGALFMIDLPVFHEITEKTTAPAV